MGRDTPRALTPTYLRHPRVQHEKLEILTRTNNRPTMPPVGLPTGAAAPAGAGVPRRAAGLLLERHDGRASGHHRTRSCRTSRHTNIWISLLVIFGLLVSFSHATTGPRALTHGLTNACTTLERILTRPVTAQGGHTLPSNRDDVPVRWASRSGNLRTRGKRPIPPDRRTHRGRKKWANYSATTKPKRRLSTIRKRARAWAGALQAQHEARRVGPTYAEAMATVPETTTEHTAPDDRMKHVTNPTLEQQEGHGPMPTDVAPSDSDCIRTLSARPGPEDTDSMRAQQVGGGFSGWIGDTFYDSDGDEPVQNRDQPAGHDTRIEPPPHPIQHHPQQTARRDPAGGWDSIQERPRGYILNN